MASNDRRPENSAPTSESDLQKAPETLDPVAAERDVTINESKGFTSRLKKVLSLLNPDTPREEPIMAALVGIDEADAIPLPNEPGLNVLRTDPSLPDSVRQEQRNQEVAAMMARTNENLTQTGVKLDDQRVEAQQPKVTRVPGEQSLIGNVVRGITSPDQLLPQDKLPESGTSDFIKGLEQAAEEGKQLGQQEARQRELDAIRALQEAEAERVRQDTEIRDRIDKAGFKIPGLPENATEDEKRAARTAYVKQMMEDTIAGLGQAAWQHEQDTLPVTLQGQMERDDEGNIINPHKRAEAEPTPPPPKLGPIDAARASRESWENGQSSEPGLDLQYIKSRSEQAVLFGFDVADPTEWERGKTEMKAFQKAMEYGIKHLDGIISTARDPKDENMKLDIVRWRKKGLFQNDFYRRYHVGHQGVSVIDAVRDGISNDLFRTGRPEWADPDVRKQMALALENQVRIKKLQHDILMMKGEIAVQEQIALKEKPENTKGFRPVVERNKRILKAMHVELRTAEAKTEAIAAELVKARAKALEDRISVEVPVKDNIGNIVDKRRVARVVPTGHREGAVAIDPITGETQLPPRPDFVPEAPSLSPEIQSTTEIQSAPVLETKEEEPQPLGEIVSAGESNRGGRKDGPDEDAVFSGSGLHLGEIGGTKDVIVSDDLERAKGLAAILNELDKPGTNPPEKFAETGESIQQLWNKIDQLKKEGKLGGLDIVIDGMGGNKVGEVGSSLAMFAILENISTTASQDNAILNGDTLRTAIAQANELMMVYNEHSGNNTGAAIVMALTSADGKTAIGVVGDARAYKISRDGSVSMLTKDQSFIFKQAGINDGIDPSYYLKHPMKNQILNHLGTKMNPDAIDIYEGDSVNIQNGDRLVLGCDGLWESAASNLGELTPEAKAILAEIDASYTLHKATTNKSVEQLQMEAQAEIFKRIILAGHENDSPAQLAKYLTRSEAGNIANDNISAVVVERKAPSPAAETAPAANDTNAPETTSPPVEPDAEPVQTSFIEPDSAETSTTDEPAEPTPEPTAQAPEANTSEQQEPEESAEAAASVDTAGDTEKTTPEERAEAITPELVEAKCVITAAGTLNIMARSGEKVAATNEKYLNLLRKNVMNIEVPNKALDTSVRNVDTLQKALSNLRVADVISTTRTYMAELRSANDETVRQEKAKQIKDLIGTVNRVIGTRISELQTARAEVTALSSETPINQDQFKVPGLAQTVREQIDQYDKLATAEEKKLLETLEEQKKAAEKAVDDLVNLDATVEAEKQAAREDDTRTPESIAADEAKVLAELERVMGKDGAKNGEEKAAIVKTLMDLFKNSKVKAPLFIAAIVVVGISGLMTSGAAGRRGRF